MVTDSGRTVTLENSCCWMSDAESVIMRILNYTVAGWASIVSIICFFSGIQLLSLGVIGEYIGKIYLETKARPRYIVEKRTEDNLP